METSTTTALVPTATTATGSGSSVALATSSSYRAGGYVSDEEAYTKGLHSNSSRRKQQYSREDFKDIYCINQKAVEGLEKSRSTGFLFLGCLSSYQESPCKRRISATRSTSTESNFFTSCYGGPNQGGQQNRPEFEDDGPPHHHHHHHQHQRGRLRPPLSTTARSATAQSKSQVYYHEPLYNQGSSASSSRIIDYQQLEDAARSGRPFSCGRSATMSLPGHHHHHPQGTYRDNLYSEAKRFTWNEQMEAYIELLPPLQQPPRQLQSSRAPAHRYPSAPLSSVHSTLDSSSARKHVSFTDSYFTRSATSTSFDEHKIRRAKLMNVSQERLLDVSGRRTPQQQQQQQMTSIDGDRTSLSLSRTSLTSCRTQATQTDNFIVRAQGPPQYLSLSPRTSYRVGYAGMQGGNRNVSRMVSQGAQTNGLSTATATATIQPDQKRASTTMTSTGTSPPPAQLPKSLASSQKSSMELVETNEEEFHENILRLFSPDNLHGNGGGCATSTTSPTNSVRSSEEGSYSLTPNKMMRKELQVNGDDEESVVVARMGTAHPPQGVKRALKGDGLAAAGAATEESSPKSSTADSVFEEFILRPPDGFADSDSNSLGNNNGQVVARETAGAATAVQVAASATTTKNKSLKKKRASVRAKSEERATSSSGAQQMGTNTCVTMGTSFKIDAATQSSISLHASLHDLTTIDDDDSGIYMEPYTSGVWVYIGGSEEREVWRTHSPLSRTTSGESTLSEQEFSRRFIALTHRMVHRKASGETYRRLKSNELEINKRVTLHRSDNGEYGFRIHGSRPVVVSAVETHSPAEDARLQVGDVIMSINGLHVLDSSHSDVVRIASQATALELELASTTTANCDVTDVDAAEEDDVVHEGVVEKLAQDGTGVKRLLRLRGDGSLYVYKLGRTKPLLLFAPLKIFSLTKPTSCALRLLDNQTIQLIRTTTISAGAEESLTFRVEDEGEVGAWLGVLRGVVGVVGEDKWIGLSGEYVGGPPSNIPNPDCDGLVWKLGRRVKVWGRRFAVLKDACLYFYLQPNSQQQQINTEQSAVGASHLHGYRVQTVSILGGKRHAFELIPPDNQMRHYYLATDSEHDRKRWLAALEYSIDRWINLSRAF